MWCLMQFLIFFGESFLKAFANATTWGIWKQNENLTLA
jgi:hypothetical protein